MIRFRNATLTAFALLAFAAVGYGQDFLAGADVSFLAATERQGIVFHDHGQPEAGLQILRAHGFNWIRLRLFVSPKDLPNDLAYTIAVAKDAKKQGFKLLLDLHYSDTWADPERQTLPKAWEGKSHQALVETVFEYTRDTVTSFRDAGVQPDMVQVGNEITAGILWPDGKLPKRWAQFADLLKAGIRGVEAGAAGGPVPQIMLHIDRGGDVEGTEYFLDHLKRYGVRYDVVGESYYPWWHGGIENLRQTLKLVAKHYGKDVVVVETSYNWQPGNYLNRPAPFPESPEGQKQFLEEVVRAVRDTPQHRGKGVFWWEPAVIGHLAGRGLFDEQHNPLPALSVFEELGGR